MARLGGRTGWTFPAEGVRGVFQTQSRHTPAWAASCWGAGSRPWVAPQWWHYPSGRLQCRQTLRRLSPLNRPTHSSDSTVHPLMLISRCFSVLLGSHLPVSHNLTGKPSKSLNCRWNQTGELSPCRRNPTPQLQPHVVLAMTGSHCSRTCRIFFKKSCVPGNLPSSPHQARSVGRPNLETLRSTHTGCLVHQSQPHRSPWVQIKAPHPNVPNTATRGQWRIIAVTWTWGAKVKSHLSGPGLFSGWHHGFLYTIFCNVMS